ncbi:translation initiation factor [Porphyromonas asaccharolytica]|uniref:translation initiation factor n=1 Tax=Porphyromonas asaccharolytica TaxID=28123 RepID=UPI00248DA27E|nr:translation initiation factor [Porphyromonas asaccharolytica]
MSKKKNKAPSTGGVVYSTDPDWSPQQACSETETLPPAQQRLRIQYSRAGRGGKEALIIMGFVGSDSDLADLARQLKQSLGCGGSTRDGEILLQQNDKEKLIKLLQSKGYKDTK